jgi:predicted HAD superfamily Cof-like phosphohydrolase
MTLSELIALLESGAEFDKTKAVDFLKAEDVTRKETNKRAVVAEAQLKELSPQLEALKLASASAEETGRAKTELEKTVEELKRKADEAEKREADLIANNKRSTELKLFTDTLTSVGLDAGRVTDHVEANYLKGELKVQEDGRYFYKGNVYDKPESLAEAVKTANADWVKPVGNGSNPPIGNVPTSTVDYSKMSATQLVAMGNQQ